MHSHCECCCHRVELRSSISSYAAIVDDLSVYYILLTLQIRCSEKCVCLSVTMTMKSENSTSCIFLSCLASTIICMFCWCACACALHGNYFQAFVYIIFWAPLIHIFPSGALWLVCCFLCSPYLVCFFIIYIPTKLANIKQDKPDFLHHFSTPVTLSSLLSELFTELKRRCVCSVARLHCLFKMYTDYITKNDMANNMGKVEKLREIFGAMNVDGKNLHIKFAQNYSWKMFEPRTGKKLALCKRKPDGKLWQVDLWRNLFTCITLQIVNVSKNWRQYGVSKAVQLCTDQKFGSRAAAEE